MGKDEKTNLPAIYLADKSDIKLLPKIEEAADLLYSQIGISGLPPAATVDELGESRVVLIAGRPPVGFVRIDEIEGQAHLEQLSVSPDHTRKGIGGMLLEHACEWAAKHGYSNVTLITYRDIPWNAPFYKKYGFEVLKKYNSALQLLRKHEIETGLDNFGHRVVMVRHIK